MGQMQTVNDASVRLESIEINNLKNVKYGKINFINPRTNYNANLLGLYGQNGSGKTALVDAINILKYILSGVKLHHSFADYVNIGCDYARLKFAIRITDKTTDEKTYVDFEFKLRKEEDSDSGKNTLEPSASIKQYKVVIFDEALSYSGTCRSGRKKILSLIDTSKGEVFGPVSKLASLSNKNKTAQTDMLVAKKLASATSRSFIFSGEFLKIVNENCKDAIALYILKTLSRFGQTELFVITSANIGMVSLNALPLSIKYNTKEKNMTAIGDIALPLNGTIVIPQEIYIIVNDVLSIMNIVLDKIIPGLTISIKNLGKIIDQNGEYGVQIQLMSLREGMKEIPLQYESDGIKKIISVLHLLIQMFNTSITVAIDELDAGIFEYLLGEILHIIQDHGKGQLIFTSHNLRPLETLDRCFIAFTTINPENRYTRMYNVKTTNNLRDLYYRDIMLGSNQNEELYMPTNNSEIALAFHEAGEFCGA